MQHKAFSVLEFSKTSSVIVVQRAFADVTGLIHQWQRTFVVVMNNFKKQGVYVRGRVQGDHALQRKMCTEFKRLFNEARASPLVMLAENLPSYM